MIHQIVLSSTNFRICHHINQFRDLLCFIYRQNDYLTLLSYSQGNGVENIWDYIINGIINFNYFDEAQFIRELFNLSKSNTKQFVAVLDAKFFDKLLQEDTVLTVHIPDRVFTIISVDPNEIYLIDYYVEAQRRHNIHVIKIERTYLLSLITAILTDDVNTYLKILDVNPNMRNEILNSWIENDYLKEQYPNEISWNRINVEINHTDCYPNINTLKIQIMSDRFKILEEAINLNTGYDLRTTQYLIKKQFDEIYNNIFGNQ
jgi:hypothetical protein